MRCFAMLAALGLGLALTPDATSKDVAQKPAEPQPGCGGYGTSVDFEETPKAAADKAKKEEKLVFVLHVSGDFEESGRT
jgi:hypothetical protein